MGYALRTRRGFQVVACAAESRRGYTATLAIAGRWDGKDRTVRDFTVPGDCFATEEAALATANALADRVIDAQNFRAAALPR